MSKGKIGRLIGSVVAAVAALGLAAGAEAQQKKIKIGVIYDLTGPFAGAGSELQYTGAKIVFDYFIKNGGVEGYQIEPIYADSQSKPDVAINEAVRLVEKENVDMLLGFYSSAQCVPVAARVEHRHRRAAFCERQRRGQAGEAAADHGDIDVAFDRPFAHGPARGRGVEPVGIVADKRIIGNGELENAAALQVFEHEIPR